MRIKSLPETERPIEKVMRHGAAVLSNAELLALLIHTGTNKKSAIRLGEEILAEFPEGIRSLQKALPEELMQVPGIGRAKAATIIAAVEIGRRAAAGSLREGRITNADDAAFCVMEDMRYEEKEHFVAMMLDAKGHLISLDRVSTGDAVSAPVNPKEAFSKAVKRGATGVIFVHNHPSGDPSPSGEDIKITERLVEAGKILGIRVLDHIIIGDGVYTSLNTCGFIDCSSG